VNLEELVRAALIKQASAEPDEAGAYDRFLRYRRRRAWQTAGSAGLAVALVLALAVGGAWLLGGRQRDTVIGPVPTTGMIRYPQQGFALTPPAGWQVDQEATQRYHQVQQAWLVLTPIGGDPQASMRITVHTAVTDPLDYPGHPGTPKDRLQLPPTQATHPLEGRRSSGRRADSRAFAVGKQDGLVTYMLAWPYHCPGQAPCPPAARWRVLQLDAGGEGAGWPEVQRVVRRLAETVRPITNALPGGPFQPEEPGLFGEPLETIATGGQGDYAWQVSGARLSPPQEGYWLEIHFPKFNGMGSSIVAGDLDPTVLCGPRAGGMVYGSGLPEVTSVRVELAGRPAVTVPTSVRDKNLPFTVWVLAPLPLHVQVRAVIGLDAAGRQVGRPAKPVGVPGAVCRA
jgi:hypothetical protein